MLVPIAAGRTDVGLERSHNEDAFVLVPDHHVYVVADGMGGHRAGDVASSMAVEQLRSFFEHLGEADQETLVNTPPDLPLGVRDLVSAISAANRKIYERSVKSREHHGMGTTLVALHFIPELGKAYVAHVGDSRCYRIRGTEVTQLTSDHSYYNEYILAMPDLTEEQRAELPRNIITRALGMHDGVQVDVCEDVYEEGDVYLLCSDGLSGMVNDEEIGEIVAATPSLDDACQALIDFANGNGGDDNITVVLVRAERAG